MEIRQNDADVIKKVNKDYVNNKTPESIEIEKKAVNVFEEANKMEQKLSDVNKIAPNDVNSLKNVLGELKKVSADVYSNLEGLINKAKSKGEEVLKKVLKDLKFTKKLIGQVSEKYEEYRKTISEEDAQTFYLYFNI